MMDNQKFTQAIRLMYKACDPFHKRLLETILLKNMPKEYSGEVIEKLKEPMGTE